MLKASACLAAILALPLLLISSVDAQPGPELSADALRQDVREWRDWLFATHPDPSFSMDVEHINAQFDQIAVSLDGEYSRRAAWLALAGINPSFRDGHVAIRPPQEDYETYLAEGGAEFTLPVTIRDGRLFVAASLDARSDVSSGAEIVRINGQDASALVGAALDRTHGDAPALRTFIVEQRFGLYLWALTGGADVWQIETRTMDGDLPRIALIPDFDRAEQRDDLWTLKIEGDAAILTLDTFRAEYEAEFAAFIEPAFAQITQSGAEILVIDISHNGGGARQLSDRLLAYLTGDRYTPISAVTARITPQNQALVPGSEVGQVLALPFAQWVEPPAELAHRFTGKTGVLISTGTYSQAIVTASIAQDFQIAAIAGKPTAGRANSTGQVQTHTLSQSGLQVAAPIYIFTRASGDQSTDPVMPDIPLSGAREAQLQALISHLRSAE